jgi:hypothetical protein
MNKNARPPQQQKVASTKTTQNHPSVQHESTSSLLSRLHNAAQNVHSATPDDVHALQRVAGNRAVTRLMQTQTQTGIVMRRSDKLPTKQTLATRAKGGKKLGATSYDKVLNEIHKYHTAVGGTAYLAQLQQLIVISQQLLDWEINHALADTGTTSKDTKEGNRRHVLADVKTDFLPKETGDVFVQARTATVNVPVPIMQQLMEIVRYDGTSLAKIEPHYATALRGYNASGGDITASKALLTNKKAELLDESGIGDYETEHAEKQVMDEDPTGGRMDVNVLQTPINPLDSRLTQAAKRTYQKNVLVKAAVQNMDSIEYGALKAYSGHVYSEMNSAARNSGPSVSKGTKKERQVEVDRHNEAKHLNLMAVSALNKLPPWGGGDIYRGEDVSWDTGNTIAQGNTIVFKSLSSTSRTRTVAEGFASGTRPAVWVIHGITASGRDIMSIAMVQKDNEFDQTLNQMSGVGGVQTGEDEVLLLPYTRVRINSVTPTSGKLVIDCTAVGG